MHWLTRFGDVDLPQYDANFNAGPAPADVATVALVGGGVFDANGSGVSRQKLPFSIRYSCTVVGPDAATARARLDALKGMIGQRAKLWRTMVDDGATQWAWARLADVDDTMRARLPKWNIPAALDFTVTSIWHGAKHQGPWRFDSGEKFDDGLVFDSSDLYTLTTSNEDLTITNSGNMPARDPVLLLTAGTNALTMVRIGISGVSEIEWNGTLASGKTLTIDCGAKSVLNDSANAWSGLALTANHKTADWLRLEKGANTVNVRRTGGGGATLPTLEIIFSDAWA